MLMNPKMREMNLRRPHIWLATWFGAGFINKAPGTWGSLAALPFGAAIYYFGGPPGLMLCAFIVFFIGLWAARRFDADAGEHDSKMIVIDEVAGQWIALIPAGLNPLMFLLSFCFFRFFDIVKPWPVSHFDKKVEGPWGVMCDDYAAGLYAAICILGVQYAGFG